jgi:hypothetical protein
MEKKADLFKGLKSKSASKKISERAVTVASLRDKRLLEAELIFGGLVEELSSVSEIETAYEEKK